MMTKTKFLWVDKPPSAAEIAAREAAERLEREEAEAARKKAEGVEFDGVMCSATKEDQDGLTAVLLSIQFQGQDFEPTLFHFANGSELVISLDNYEALASTWIKFRKSFFKVKE